MGKQGNSERKSNMIQVYDHEFYNMISRIIPDEKQIIPYVLERLNPKSIVDFGCGEGLWLMEAKRNDGSIKVLGLDGNYINRSRLLIAQDEFLGVDLRKKIELSKKFDLAISTEVAEHIEKEYVDVFVDNLTRAADCILFSAAVPGQGGDHHVNEQWQSYWVKKFKSRGYVPDFSIRNHFWNNENMNCWRKQNLIMFFKTNQRETVKFDIIDVVHPDMFKSRIDRSRKEMGESIEYMLRCPEITESIKNALKYLVEQKRKIIIYPYGGNGRLCELMLNYFFHYDNFLIVDNKKGGKEEKIFTFDALQNGYEDAIILDVCSNTSVHQELLNEIKGKATKMERITLFDN